MPLRHTHDPDPILTCGYTVRRGLSINNKRDVRNMVYTAGAHCGERNRPRDGGIYTCTRPDGHPDWWKHVAADGYEVLSVWGGSDQPADGDLIDPEDGSPVDPADIVDRSTITVGGVYKLRDRKNKLQVIGGLEDAMPRKDGWIDVMDLTLGDQRALPVEELVFVPGLGLNMDDLTSLVGIAQKLRLKIRDQAIANYHAGKWCENGLQDGLRDLGLPKYEATQTGEIAIRIPYTALSGAGTTGIKAAVKELLDLEAIKNIMVDPENDDELTLKTDELKFAVEGVHRR